MWEPYFCLDDTVPPVLPGNCASISLFFYAIELSLGHHELVLRVFPQTLLFSPSSSPSSDNSITQTSTCLYHYRFSPNQHPERDHYRKHQPSQQPGWAFQMSCALPPSLPDVWLGFSMLLDLLYRARRHWVPALLMKLTFLLILLSNSAF